MVFRVYLNPEESGDEENDYDCATNQMRLFTGCFAS